MISAGWANFYWSAAKSRQRMQALQLALLKSTLIFHTIKIVYNTTLYLHSFLILRNDRPHAV